ncbi:hypothetical protein NM688_g7228 [Phlebia brevispora]|uniref:Uncharacterized protein n=1 Tax=Phlebia brevispora TaxID=194682 RepID=A0ACC1S7T8_9APHY|nr:hypothetical protein NM688_g7228 [Phlebia brevispora]
MRLMRTATSSETNEASRSNSSSGNADSSTWKLDAHSSKPVPSAVGSGESSLDKLSSAKRTVDLCSVSAIERKLSVLNRFIA